MNDKSNITEILSHLAKRPLISVLIIPITLIYCATKFANATVSSQIFFGVICASAIIFAVWVTKQFMANGINR